MKNNQNRKLRRLKNKIKISGITTDNKYVISGCYNFVNSIGLPLEYVIDYLYSQNMVVDWIEYYNSAILMGCNENSLQLKIENALIDVFGTEYKNNVMLRLINLKE